MQLKGTGKAYDLNNNKAMITDVMGDDYDQEEYGNEGFNREAEAGYDFMWDQYASYTSGRHAQFEDERLQ